MFFFCMFVFIYSFVSLHHESHGDFFFFYVLFYLNDIMYENLTSLHDRNLFVRMDKILVDPAINVQSFLSSCERYTVRTQLHTPSDMLLFEIMQINN